MKLAPAAFLELLEDLSLIPDARLIADEACISWSEHKLMLPVLTPLEMSEIQNIGELHRFWSDWSPTYLVILIRAGNASLGYWQNGELQVHKVIRKYMVRKKQGKTQLSHLKTKGKSRLGSRIRLQESKEFFEEINEKVTEWVKEFNLPELIFYSCPVNLKSPWLESKVPLSFDLKTKRVRTVPFHVYQPTHDELLRVNRLLTSATLLANEEPGS